MLTRTCFLLCLAAAASGAKVTPMEKVIGLLKDLEKKVTAEGKKEAAQYDKFACFCKEQADEKLYSIEKSTALIADLSAEIKKLGDDINELNGDVSKLSQQISGLENTIADKQAKRDAKRAIYEAKAKDQNEAIDMIERAIDALKDSKGDMSGAKLDLLQKAVTKVIGDAAPKFEYQSNDIITTLEDLLATFKKNKKDLDFEEHDDMSAFEKTKLALLNEKKFAEKDKAEKEQIIEAKTEEKNQKESDRSDETNDKNADDSFLNELTNQCQAKANAFDQRSSARGDELKALNSAIDELSTGAKPNFEANSELVGLQKSALPAKSPTTASSPVAFVQIKSVQHQQSGRSEALTRVRSLLDEAADRSGSRVLASIAVRVRVAEDHFVKVRGLIKDLIKKLENDAKEEATQKGNCDVGIAKATSDRDTANANIEAANAEITKASSNKDELNEEINRLNGEIAELKKGLLEATELRNEAKAENEERIEMSQAGADSVNAALSTLKGFYNNALVQTKKYTPPLSDRSGNTVGDLAPDTFSNDKYSGAQNESKGIVGILEVILSDFERTNSKTKSDERQSESDYDTFESDTNSDVAKKEARIKAAEGEVEAAEGTILANEEDLNDANKLLDSATASLDELHEMCVKGEETYAERVQKRKEEIEALKDAMDILDNWQS